MDSGQTSTSAPAGNSSDFVSTEIPISPSSYFFQLLLTMCSGTQIVQVSVLLSCFFSSPSSLSAFRSSSLFSPFAEGAPLARLDHHEMHT